MYFKREVLKVLKRMLKGVLKTNPPLKIISKNLEVSCASVSLFPSIEN